MRGDEGMLKSAVQVDTIGVEEQPKLIMIIVMIVIIIIMIMIVMMMLMIMTVRMVIN